jgi:hypothetical protein
MAKTHEVSIVFTNLESRTGGVCKKLEEESQKMFDLLLTNAKKSRSWTRLPRRRCLHGRYGPDRSIKNDIETWMPSEMQERHILALCSSIPGTTFEPVKTSGKTSSATPSTTQRSPPRVLILLECNQNADGSMEKIEREVNTIKLACNVMRKISPYNRKHSRSLYIAAVSMPL